MELTLSKEQKKYLDQSGLYTARELQTTFVKSVKDQQSISKRAAKIRAKRK